MIGWFWLQPCLGLRQHQHPSAARGEGPDHLLLGNHPRRRAVGTDNQKPAAGQRFGNKRSNTFHATAKALKDGLRVSFGIEQRDGLGGNDRLCRRLQARPNLDDPLLVLAQFAVLPQLHVQHEARAGFHIRNAERNLIPLQIGRG